MSTNFIEPLGKLAADFFDQVTDAIVGEASTLRDGTEHAGVELPRDLYAHHEAQTEWWYYTGHMRTAAGRRFGFELVFFKRRTDLDRFGVVPSRLSGTARRPGSFLALSDDICNCFVVLKT